MYKIEFCRAPSNMWVGACIYNGGHVFASGRTMDELVKHMKNYMYNKYRVSALQIIINEHQTDQYEYERKYKVFMSSRFVSRFWREKNVDRIAQPVNHAPVITKEKPAPEKEFITEMDDGYMVVYELREVARYKLRETTSKQPRCPVNLDTTEPVLTF